MHQTVEFAKRRKTSMGKMHRIATGDELSVSEKTGSLQRDNCCYIWFMPKLMDAN